MPKFDLSIPHTLGKDQALARLQGFSEKIREKYQDQLSQLDQSWDGDQMSFSFTTFGISVSGTMIVQEEAVQVGGNLPLTAAMFKGKITDAINEQLGKLLS